MWILDDVVRAAGDAAVRTANVLLDVFFAPGDRDEHSLRLRMAAAATYAEWLSLAERVDSMRGADTWRTRPLGADEHLYDEALVRARLGHIGELVAAVDSAADDGSSPVGELMYFLRAGLLRSLGGIGRPQMHTQALAGTKTLVEDYVSAVAAGLECVARSAAIADTVKAAYFAELQQTLGRTALVLHGGASFGLCHLGVLQALHAAGLFPPVLVGSYVGALCAAFVAVKTPEARAALFAAQRSPGALRPCAQPEKEGASVLAVDLSALAPGAPGRVASFRRKITRLLKTGRLLDVRALERCARRNIGDATFREAHALSGIVLNIIVRPRRAHEVPVVLNHVTAPDLMVWSAAVASCAFPLVYDAAILLARRPSDGAVYPWRPAAVRLQAARTVHTAPMRRIAEQFNVSSVVVSDVPSYLAPVRLARYAEGAAHPGGGPSTHRRGLVALVVALVAFVLGEAVHRVAQLEDLGLLPAWLHWPLSLVRPPAVGDVRITPAIHCGDARHLLATPTRGFMAYCMQKGRVATWRRMAHLRVRGHVEVVLDRLSRRFPV